MKIEEILSQVKAMKKYDTGQFVRYNVLSTSVLDISEEELIAIEDQWNEIKAHNSAVSKHNSELLSLAMDEIEKFFKAVGLPTYKTSKYGKILGEYKEFKAAKGSLENQIRTWSPVDKPSLYEIEIDSSGKTMKVNNHHGSLSKFVERAKTTIAHKKKIEDAKTSEYKKACALAESFGISLDSEYLLSLVLGCAKDKYVADNYPDDEEVSFDQCDDCSTWVVGEHRCSCGNRRVSLCVEGTFDNFYAYPEAY